jgi:hypothetical protein
MQDTTHHYWFKNPITIGFLNRQCKSGSDEVSKKHKNRLKKKKSF